MKLCVISLFNSHSISGKINIFCASGTVYPILISLKNKNKQEDKVLNIKGNKFIFINLPKVLRIPKSSNVDLLLFVSCVSGNYNISFFEENRMLYNFNISISQIPNFLFENIYS